MRDKIITTLVIIGLTGFIGMGVNNVRHSNQKLQLNEIELKSKETQLIELNTKYDQVIQLKTKTEKEKQEQLKQIKQLEKDRESLQRELQAKLNRQQAEKERLARASEKALQVQKVQAAAPQVTGICADWIASAGISDVINASELIRRESNCNPSVVNPSSGSCGVAQELPCGKSGCSLGDGACQVRWMDSYIKSRYGSWSNAVAHHNAKNWY